MNDIIFITIIIHVVGIVLLLSGIFFSKKNKEELAESHAFLYGFLALMFALIMDITLILIKLTMVT